MNRLWTIFISSSVHALPEEYRKEYWNEVVYANLRRIRSLLMLSAASYLFLIYVVNIRNTFLLPEADNRLVLTMHLVQLVGSLGILGVIILRSPASPQEITSFHSVLLALFGIVFLLSIQLFIFTIIKTQGHPVFAFVAILVWCASLLIPPRVQAVFVIILTGSLLLLMALVPLPTDNVRFTGEASVVSCITAVMVLVTGSILFKTNLEAFRQRKLVEEERNKIARLNEETSALNQELQRRQDILEQQAMEIEIINTKLQEQNQSLHARDAEKNELMNIVAHDLKNPIGAIRSFAELVESRLIPVEEAPDISAKIVELANRMLDLVTNLLDLNRLEEGAMTFNCVEFDIALFVENMVAQYRQTAEAKNITLHYSRHTASTFVRADEQSTLQVLDNIISNAVKYSPHGKNVFIRLNTNNDAVRVEVQDEGQGISSEDMKKLFGKFARLSARPTGGEHSTGPGLSIVKKMVEAMNGKVWCESELSKGATFIVELPSS